MTSNTIVLTCILACGCIILPKRLALLPFVVAACLVPMNQRIYIIGLDFTVLRILVLFGMLRLLLRGEAEPIRWHSFDKLVLSWNVCSLVIYAVQYASLNALINRCGVMYDNLGMYWIFRHSFRSFYDINQAVKMFLVCAFMSTPLIIAEKFNQSSVFSLFGPTGADFHRGRFRCAGSFPHYIMLGCFWVSLVPIFYASFKARIAPQRYLLGTVCALIIVYFSASSTPLLTIVAMMILWQCYNYRHNGKVLFRLLLLVLLFLHIIMNAPVWHLMARVNIFGGSTGWHRYHLFDQFVKHTSEWFFLGTQSTSHWGSGLTDITNQYVLEAVRGGIVSLILFISVLYRAIKICGQSSLLLVERQPADSWVAWGVCISLLGHSISFWGVSYFGQIMMLFYMTLAMTAFLAEVNTEMIVEEELK